jgi:hypothetical protein
VSRHELKACTACALHITLGRMHLCTLGPECFDLRDDDGDPREPAGEWIGMDCDRARKMSELCGPAGTLWEPHSP